MKKHIIIPLTLVIFLMFSSDLYSRNLSGNSLFADHKSRNVGDLLTVKIIETASASNEAKTSTSNSNGLALSGAGTGALDFMPSLGATGSSSLAYSGTGKTERKGSLKAVIECKLVEILPNGNYIIEGNKIIEVNGEKQITSLNGLIRPEDIDENNSVNSNNIANLNITYTGVGVVEEAEEPGMITRFFNWLF